MERRLTDRVFFLRDVHDVARDLLGKLLVVGEAVVRIVEVEAYAGALDEASHAHKGQTPRNSAMFGQGGHLYVYFVYGMHFCMNMVTGESQNPGAVLLRAAEPLHGLETMRKRRGLTIADRDLCRGPARLTQALGIDAAWNGIDVCAPDSAVYLVDDGFVVSSVSQSPRIGIASAQEFPWRYYLDSPYISGRR